MLGLLSSNLAFYVCYIDRAIKLNYSRLFAILLLAPYGGSHEIRVD